MTLRPRRRCSRWPAGRSSKGATIDAARGTLERTIAVCESAESPFQLPAAHAVLGLWPVFSGELHRTRHHARLGGELAVRVGRPGWEAIGLAGLAAADILQGDHGRARELLTAAEGPATAWSGVGTSPEGVPASWLAWSAYAAGDLEAARTTATELVRIGRGRDSHWDESLGEWLLGLVALSRAASTDARIHLEACRALASDPRLSFPLGRSLLGLAALAAEGDELHQAWDLAHDGLEIVHEYGDRVGAAAALEQIAELAVALGDPERAVRLLAASEQFHSATGLVRLPLEAVRFDRARAAAMTALR